MVTACNRAEDLARRIERLLSEGGASLEREGAQTAADYAELCAEANERLERCRLYLDAELFEEAIHAAELAPDVLSLISALDLPERERWNAICREFGWRVAPPLAFDVAERLNQAYAERPQPLISAFEAQRALVLARAPLARRLELLRTLTRLAPDLETLDALVPEYETARLDEIDRTLAHAQTGSDLEALEALEAELKKPHWRSSRARSCLERVRAKLQAARAEAGRAKLENLAAGIERAHAAMDPNELAALETTWRKTIEETGAEVPRELAARVRPAFEWLAQEQESERKQAAFEAACAELLRAVESETEDAASLRDRFLAATAFSLPLDPTLEQRYRDAVHRLERNAALRRRNRVLLIAAAALLFSVTVVVLVRMRVRESRMQRSREAIAAALEKGRLPEARAAWDAFAAKWPELARSPALADLHARLARAEEEERARREAFNRAVADIEAAQRADRSAATELAQAEKLARTEAELTRVAALASREARAEAARVERKEKAFYDALQALLDRARALEPSQIEQDLERFDRTLADLRRRQDALLAQPGVSETMKRAAQPLTARLEALARAREQALSARKARAAEAADLRMLPALTAKPQEYAEALGRFVQRYPDSPRRRAFSKAAANAPAWFAVHAWLEMVEPWRTQPVVRTLGAARERLERLDAYLARYQRGPFDREAKLLKAFQQRFVDVEKARRERFAQMRRVLLLPLISGLDVVIDRQTGKRYYVPSGERPIPQGEKVTVRVVRGLDVKKTALLVLPKQALDGPMPSPQARLAAKLQERLDLYDRAHALTFWLEIADEIAQAEEVDPILRVELLARVLPYAATDGWGVENEITRWVNAIGSRPVVRWTDPDDSAAQLQRERWRAILAKMPLERLLEKARAAEQKTLSHLELAMPRRLGNAMLVRTDDLRGWEVRFGGPPIDEPARLWTATIGRESQDALIDLGALNPGAPLLESAPPKEVPEGSLVFLVTEREEER